MHRKTAKQETCKNYHFTSNIDKQLSFYMKKVSIKLETLSHDFENSFLLYTYVLRKMFGYSASDASTYFNHTRAALPHSWDKKRGRMDVSLLIGVEPLDH